MKRWRRQGRMLVAELEKLMGESKEAGRVPFYVQATAGTTVLGAYDNLAEICPIAKRFGAWVHVDGCWGASVALSSKWKTLLEGTRPPAQDSWGGGVWAHWCVCVRCRGCGGGLYRMESSQGIHYLKTY